ncbi:hypothetical protein F4809DRAFT_609690 [Biscogniauxia mediterranea]|nr:hypothetical protein F4809DRAFT_609690 [Biscogniauxia mediterranea]
MRPSDFLVALVALNQSVHAANIPGARDIAIDISSQPEPEAFDDHELWKRKGGGGRGGSSGSSSSSSGSRTGSSGSGRSGSSGSSSSSSSSGSSGSSGGGRGGSSSSSSSGGRGSSSSNAGGSTTTGSGVRPAYGGGAYYGGGAKVPYTAGSRSASGIVPGFVGGAALGAVAFVGISWAYGAYLYPYAHRYYYHNATTNQNETRPVTCVCGQYSVCSCDDNGNTTYFNSVIGDGSYEGLNKSLVTVADNSTNGNETTIYILGDLPNGTTAAGGTESPNDAGGMMDLLHVVGWWPVVTGAFTLAFLL